VERERLVTVGLQYLQRAEDAATASLPAVDN
jgi:hypothetical protein